MKFRYFSAYSVVEISADLVNHVQSGNHQLIRLEKFDYHIRRFKAECAVIAAVLQAGYKSFPTDNADIGADVRILRAAYIVNVKRNKSVAELLHGECGVESEKIEVACVQAEAEELFACDFVELIDINASLRNVGADSGIYLFRYPVLSPHIFKTAGDAVFLRLGMSAVYIPIDHCHSSLRLVGYLALPLKAG